ncbi:MAG: UPF0280 family protein [Syntrophorhabdaceae bacterium]|nr:UPF0280 family protein [Syntrophorhabdaceae bacterium]
MYEERFYRRISKPKDLLSYEVRVKETDLLCCTEGDLKPLIEERVLFYRNQIEEYIKLRPDFKESLVPVCYDSLAPAIVRDMMGASSIIGVGPMATVAGAIAEYIGKDLEGHTGECIIENGGDIYLKTEKERTVLVYANDSPYSERIGIKIKGRKKPYGICTSSATVGPSLSFGKADAVCVIGDSALFVDGLASLVGNIVKDKDDIPDAIEAGRRYEGVIAILVIKGGHLGAWGDLEIVKV